MFTKHKSIKTHFPIPTPSSIAQPYNILHISIKAVFCDAHNPKLLINEWLFQRFDDETVNINHHIFSFSPAMIILSIQLTNWQKQKIQRKPHPGGQ